MEQPNKNAWANTFLRDALQLFAFLLILVVSSRGAESHATASPEDTRWLSPSALAASTDGGTLFVACGTAPEILVVNVASGRATNSIVLPAVCTGLVANSNPRQVYVTCAAPASQVCQVDLTQGRVVRSFAGRHTPVSPVLSADGKTLFVCERFNSVIVAYDLESGKETKAITVAREPMAAATSGDGRLLLVAHHLPAGRADAPVVSAHVSLIELSTGRVQELPLPNGSSLARDIKVSPDDRYAGVTHNLARFQMPTTQVERGWMNTSALTLIDLEQRRVVTTLLLDEIDRGAANPWALGWSKDGRWLFVSHAGTHELSVIHFPKLIAKLQKIACQSTTAAGLDGAEAPANDLAFLLGIRERVKLLGNGPRALTVVGDTVFVADYFSDLIELVRLGVTPAAQAAWPLHGSIPRSQARRGEMLFNDARLCFQGWQSCGTCHSEDARTDGLNWDLLNDGLGNPKNSKSLLLAHQTPPAMSTGVRETAETAVRAGLRHILFSTQPEEVSEAMDAWLKSLRPVPSPYLVQGKLSPAALRGQRLFQSARVGCAGCHPADLWTNLRQYDVGTANELDGRGQLFDTPTLVELWRTAPYLHDGSAATLRDVLTTRNPSDRHGFTAQLSAAEIDDLLQYLLTL